MTRWALPKENVSQDPGVNEARDGGPEIIGLKRGIDDCLRGLESANDHRVAKKIASDGIDLVMEQDVQMITVTMSSDISGKGQADSASKTRLKRMPVSPRY